MTDDLIAAEERAAREAIEQAVTTTAARVAGARAAGPWVYHKTNLEALQEIRQSGFTQGDFIEGLSSFRKVDFPGDVSLRVRQGNLPPGQVGEYGRGVKWHLPAFADTGLSIAPENIEVYLGLAGRPVSVKAKGAWRPLTELPQPTAASVAPDVPVAPTAAKQVAPVPTATTGTRAVREAAEEPVAGAGRLDAALRGAGQVGAGLRGAGQRFAAAMMGQPPRGKPPSTVGRIEPVGDIPPVRQDKNLLPNLGTKAFKVQFDIVNEPNAFRRMGEKFADTPVIGNLIRWSTPSAVAKSVIARVAVTRAQLRDAGAQKVQRAMGAASRFGEQDDLFGRTDELSGLIVDGPFFSPNRKLTVNQIAENPDKFIKEFPSLFDKGTEMGRNRQAWLNSMSSIEEAILRHYKNAGIDIKRIVTDEGLLLDDSVERYAGRIIAGKFDADGNLIEMKFIGADPKRISLKPGQAQQRVYTTAEKAVADGFVIMRYDQSVALRAKAAVDRVVDLRTVQFVGRNLPNDIKIRMAAVPERVSRDLNIAQSQLDVLEDIKKAANKAINGGYEYGATLVRIRSHAPKLAKELDDALSISPEQLTKGLGLLARKARPELNVKSEDVLEALRAVRGVGGREIRKRKRDITPTEMREVVRKLVKGQHTGDKVEQKIFESVYVEGKAKRNAALRAVKDKAEAAKGKARETLRKAKDVHTAALEASRQPFKTRGERMLDLPSLEKRFISPKRGADPSSAIKFHEDFNKMMKTPESDAFIRGIAGLNAVQRVFVLAGDASFFTIQFLAAMYRHPGAVFKSSAIFGKALASAFFDAKAVKRAHEQFIYANRDFFRRHPKLINSGSGLEYTEALGARGLLRKRRVLGEGITAGERLRGVPSLLAAPLRPFQQAFEYSMDVAGVHMAKGLEHIAKGNPAKLNVIDDYVNSMRGLISSAALGVPTNQRMTESAILLAARYRRAVASIYVSALQGGLGTTLRTPVMGERLFMKTFGAKAVDETATALRGKLAREALVSLATGLTMTYVGVSIALGVKEGKSMEQIKKELSDTIQPNNPRFMLWNIGGQVVGPGSKFISDIRLLGKVAGTAKDIVGGEPLEEGNLLDFEEFQENPSVRWVRGQLAGVPGTAWDVFTGENYMGEPVELTDPDSMARELGNWSIPIWTQSVLMEGGTADERFVRGVGEFFGLRAFPQSAYDILSDESFDIIGNSYDEIESFEKDILREVLSKQLIPLQEKQVTRGRELAKYFSELEEIEDERRKKLKKLAGEDWSWVEYKKIDVRAAGRRFQAGIDQEFEETNPEDPDPLKAALAQRNQLFADPELRDEAGDLTPEFSQSIKRLEESWTPEQMDYVARNTNRRPIPRSILVKLPKSLLQDIIRSQSARERYLIKTGREDLAKASRSIFLMEEEMKRADNAA